MKRFNQFGAQGELYITRIEKLPEGVQPVLQSDGDLIIGHSETGHHHVMNAERTTLYRLPEEIYECFVVVTENDELRHLRSFDTHESWMFEPGVYEIQRAREYIPEGWRPSAD